jgi:holo-[acyl-carrier protein] synthase
MISGVGIDIVSKSRILNIKNLKKFAERILSRNEKLIFENFDQNKNKAVNLAIDYLAKRFCAKEAISKAIGIGIGRDFNFNDISIMNDSLGKPMVSIKDIIRHDIKISISDEKENCVSVAIWFDQRFD